MKNNTPNQDEFDTIHDLRPYLLGSDKDRTQDCLHYLGDRAQEWYAGIAYKDRRMAIRSAYHLLNGLANDDCDPELKNLISEAKSKLNVIQGMLQKQL